MSDIPIYKLYQDGEKEFYSDSANIHLVILFGMSTLQYSLPEKLPNNKVIELKNFLEKKTSSFHVEWPCYCCDGSWATYTLILSNDDVYIESCSGGACVLVINDSFYIAFNRYLSIISETL